MTTASPDPDPDLGVDPAPLPPRVLVTLLVQLADAPPPPPPPELMEWIEQWSRTGVPPPRGVTRLQSSAGRCSALVVSAGVRSRVDRVAGTGDRRHGRARVGPVLSVSRATLRVWLIVTLHQRPKRAPVILALVLRWALMW